MNAYSREKPQHWFVLRAISLAALCTSLALTGCGEDTAAPGANTPDTQGGGTDASLGDTLTDVNVELDTVVADVWDIAQLDIADVVQLDTALDATEVTEDVAPDVPQDTGPSCPSDHCLIDTVCYENLAANPANPCQRCFALSDQIHWSSDDASKCDDNSSCTPDDHCVDGKCTGTPTKDCNDGNACTSDDCTAAGGCVHTNLSDAAPCDDGNACTTGDVCVNSICLPGQVTTDCNDNDSCTIDACDVKLGCEHTATGSGPCDDNNACTGNDTCGAGGCAGTALDCDDGSVCTIDSCDLFKGCVHDDSVAKFCSDTNPCTDETCDPKLGCVYPYNTSPCDDGDLCTTGDHCDTGKCLVTKTVCDDKNPCTTDSCSAISGSCVYLPNSATCSDDDVCTLGDYCQDTSCWPGNDKLPCDDGNLCTIDTCDATAGCQVSPNILPCDDGSKCTVNDHCADKACTGLPLDCDDNDVCTIDSCDPIAGCKHDNSIAANCKDDNLCTDETCDPKTGCVYPFNTVPCDKTLGIVHLNNKLPCEDGNVCTLNDACLFGGCAPGSAQLACDDGNPCTDDSCDPIAGCVFNANNAPCDDNTVCTTNDVCSDKSCHGTAIVCDDGNACTADSCDPVKGCQTKLIINKACRPTIVIDYPPRAATIKGVVATPSITVLGHVTDQAGPITSVTVNGTAVTLDVNGAFSYPMSTIIGGNEIVVVATDSFGTSKQVVQSYLWSDNFYKPVYGDHTKGIIDPGLAYYLSKSVIDDGVHTMPANDLATVFEQVLATYKLETYIPSSINASGITVNISNLKYGSPAVVLTPQAGSLHMAAKIPNISADLKATLLIIPVTGKLTADSLNIETDLVPSVDANHNAVITMTNTVISFTNFKVTIAGLNVTGLLNGTITSLTTSLVPQLKTALEPALSSAFNALAFKTDFQLGKLDGSGNKIGVNLYNDYNSITCATDGMIFMMRPRASAAVGPALVNYDELGIPARSHCGDGQPQQVKLTKVGKMELVISDDAFNELLGAVWSGGLLEFPVGASLLGNVDLSTYGVTDLAMNVDAMLPPVMEDCSYISPVAQIGDLRVFGSLKLFGKQVDFTLYATFKTDVAVTASNSAIGIALNGIKSADVQVDIAQDDMVGSEGALAELVKTQVLGALVGKLTGSALGSFPIPAINLNIGTASVSLSIATDQVVRVEGNSVVQGHLQ